MTRQFLLHRYPWFWPIAALIAMLVFGVTSLDAQEQQSASTTFGGGGRGGMGGFPVLIEWRKPQGEKPDWLTRGENAIRAHENMRRKLDQEGEFSFDKQPLGAVVTSISDRYGFEIQIDQKGLEAEELTPEEPITIKTRGSLRSCLHRILGPLNLAYVVHEDCLEITARQIASYAVRAYNLTHVASNSLEGVEIVNTIKKMVQPDAWLEGGDGSCHLIGSVLLVKASEGTHEDIERLLAQLNVMRADEKNP
jgi:hypothetical protein